MSYWSSYFAIKAARTNRPLKRDSQWTHVSADCGELSASSLAPEGDARRCVTPAML
jgi:hypothetical protein